LPGEVFIVFQRADGVGVGCDPDGDLLILPEAPGNVKQGRIGNRAELVFPKVEVNFHRLEHGLKGCFPGLA